MIISKLLTFVLIIYISSVIRELCVIIDYSLQVSVGSQGWIPGQECFVHDKEIKASNPGRIKLREENPCLQIGSKLIFHFDNILYSKIGGSNGMLSFIAVTRICKNLGHA